MGWSPPEDVSKRPKTCDKQNFLAPNIFELAPLVFMAWIAHPAAREETGDGAAERKANKSWVLALVSIATCMVALDAMVVTTALSAIRLSLGGSLEALEWTVNAYNLSFAVLLMAGAALGDRLGRRRMFCSGVALFALGSAACGLAINVGWLIAARALQGAGAALVVPLAMALLGVAFAREERARALGLLSGAMGVALIVGPVVGRAIAPGLAWQ